ncbi:hypothetical protein CANARDRAFT_29940 [[Candida] arabinofermentans NRRL YB-2248]|uniref:Major facilitator superfamily (MFS) profile domain-containing protein n=1 Tax=[Candida] arabinofermentans NRRL YB-2248 TaxID=983967 RepID=A0A1E4SVG4_9ASCO|nr:hypothetical protein CANARDRAFT_29940 [[Candida] arabinofermentans NRRL YB-2248]
MNGDTTSKTHFTKYNEDKNSLRFQMNVAEIENHQNSNTDAQFHDVTIDFENASNDDGGVDGGDGDDRLGSRMPIILYSFMIAMGGLIFGYDIGTIGGLIDMPSFSRVYGDRMINDTVVGFHSLTKGTIVSASSIGGCIGGLFSMKVVPWIGLRGTLFCAFSIYLIGNLITLMAGQWVQIVVGRVCNGVANGIICVVGPMLISELAPSGIRGSLVSVQQLMTTVGIVIGALTLFASHSIWDISNNLQFQWGLIQGILLCVISGILIWYVPESPYWYLNNLKSIDRTKKSVARARSLDVNDPSVLRTVAVMFDSTQDNEQDDEYDNGDDLLIVQKLRKSIRKGQPRYLLRTLTGIGLLCFQQFSGINYFFFFGTTIFAGIGVNNPYHVPIFFGLFNLVFSLISIVVVEKFNRTTLLMMGSLSMATFMSCFSIAGLYFNESTVAVTIMILSSCCFVSTFALSWGPLSNVVVSELYPNAIKVKAMSICGCLSWIATFIISLAIPALSESLGFSLGFIFVGLILIGFIFVALFVPETKNSSIESLNEKYENGEIWKTRLKSWK